MKDFKKMHWTRCIQYSTLIKFAIDENLLGLAKSYCFHFKSNSQNLFNSLIHLANTCKQSNAKKFTVSLGQIEMVDERSLDRTQKPIKIVTHNQLIERVDRMKIVFAIHYALLALFSRSYTNLDMVTIDGSLGRLLDFVQNAIQRCPQPLTPKDVFEIENALFLTKSEQKNSLFINIFLCLKRFYAKRSSFKPPTVADDCVLIRKAIFTPTNMELLPPMPLLRSRFTVMANIDYALRLQIMDDSDQSLLFVRGADDVSCLQVLFCNRLMNGIRLGDRMYDFLGSSTSQMREGGLLMYAIDDQGYNAQAIREMAGDLNKFNRQVAKFVARLGLIFSQVISLFI